MVLALLMCDVAGAANAVEGNATPPATTAAEAANIRSRRVREVQVMGVFLFVRGWGLVVCSA
jgi:hypothetical protein